MCISAIFDSCWVDILRITLTWAKPLCLSDTHCTCLIVSLRSSWLNKKTHLVLISQPLMFFIFIFLLLSLWKTVTVHSLAWVTTARTTKPLTPKCSHCQILSVFSWKLHGPRCYEPGLQTDKHCYRGDPPQSVHAGGQECQCWVFTLSPKTSWRKQGFYPQSMTFHHFQRKSKLCKYKLVSLSLAVVYNSQFSRSWIHANNSQR